MPNNRKTSLDVDAFLAAVEGRFDHRTLRRRRGSVFARGRVRQSLLCPRGKCKGRRYFEARKGGCRRNFRTGGFSRRIMPVGPTMPDIHGDCDERMLGRPHRQRNHAEFARIRSLILNIIPRSISSRETPESKRTSSIICSIPVKNAWRGRSCFSPISARRISSDPVSAKINQELLAEMVGTTRSRVSHFMNKFRRLGFIEYNGRIEVHSSLFNVLLYEGDGLSYDGDES